jgi:hypothetical protein
MVTPRGLVEGGIAAIVLLAACGSGGPTPPPPSANPPGWTAALDGALRYLGTTTAEFGLDALVAVQIVGEVTADRRAEEIVTARRPAMRPQDLERYGLLLDVPKPVLPASSLAGVSPSPTTPDPEMLPPAGESNILVTCLTDALQCRLDDTCRAFIELDDRWGYVLTHQAVWILFARWAGCSFSIDLESRRRTFGANLVKEMRADPAPSDLTAERLAMLGHLGFGRELDPAWIATLLGAQTPEGCWRPRADRPCHPHPTALALWALALARAAGAWR